MRQLYTTFARFFYNGEGLQTQALEPRLASMARTKKETNGTNGKNGNGANLGFEQTLWAAADKMRGHMDAAEYKHVALELIFLKYISDAFQELYDDLVARQETEYTDPEDRDEYMGSNVFWVPKEARWSHIQANAKQPTIGKLIDEAMLALEKENPRLKGVLPIQYARPDLDKQRLGELIDLISTLGLSDSSSQLKDILGRVYEYFLGQFAKEEGKRGSEFYTPQSVAKLLVAMTEPYNAQIYDPPYSSGAMFVQPELMKVYSADENDVARSEELGLTIATTRKITYLPTLGRWLTNTVQMSTDGNYSHRRLEEDLTSRAGIIYELQNLIHQAHEDARQKLRDLAGISSSLDPLEEEATPGVETSIIDEFPRYLELKTLKGYFGEIMAAVVAENFNPFNEDWQIFAFPFRLHQAAYHALEQVRQQGSAAPTIVGRLGDDMLAFQCNNRGEITHVLFCEAKCTARHSNDLIAEAHRKSSDSKTIPVDCLSLIDILQDYAVAGSDAERWIRALRKLYFSNNNPTHERCDLVNYICGLPPARANTEIIPRSAPHMNYTAGRRLEAVEIHLHDVNGLIEEVYQAITQPIVCTLDETGLSTLWDEVVLHIPTHNQDIFRENCLLLFFDGKEAVIGVLHLTTFREIQRKTNILQDAFQTSGNFTPNDSQGRIKISLKMYRRL